MSEGSLSYRIVFSPDAEEQLHGLAARQQALVLDQVERHLAHQPTAETRNRKRMRPNPLAPWELRIADLRVYYDVESLPEPTVSIRAVGAKEHSQLRIAGKVVQI
jgi:mRNA-degrading endonuclease RelE of RelBE toxin-antitoxin system